MEKQDVMYVVAGLAIILVIAVFIKPMITGQPVNTGITAKTIQTTVPITNPPIAATNFAIITITKPPTPTPTPVPLSTYGNGKVVTVGFVNPEAYPLLTPEIPNATEVENTPVDSSMTTIAEISGQFSGVTQVINIPFPYWQMSYTANPIEGAGGNGGNAPAVGSSTYNGPSSAILTNGTLIPETPVSNTVIQGSYSVTIPTLSIQVMDAGDPNRIVRTVEPPGGLTDSSLWVTSLSPTGQIISTDPRPWVEKFYEGERGYYFIINANSLLSYEIDIQVPTRYIGKY